MIEQFVLGSILVLSSLGVIVLKKPVHACLSFLLTLLTLAAIYLQLNAPFIAVMQVLVYAGAILVIFMFVIVLFQDAYKTIQKYKAESSPLWLFIASVSFVAALAVLGSRLANLNFATQNVPPEYGSVQALGRALYVDFFFPFEAVGLLFLVAIVGALYIGKKVR